MKRVLIMGTVLGLVCALARADSQEALRNDINRIRDGRDVQPAPQMIYLRTDTIHERTSGSGVTVDGLLIKDGAVAAAASSTQSVGSLTVAGNATITSNVTAKTASVGTSATVGSLSVLTNASVSGSASVGTSLTTGSLAVNTNASIGTTLSVGTQATVGGLTVNTNATISGATIMNGTPTVLASGNTNRVVLSPDGYAGAVMLQFGTVTGDSAVITFAKPFSAVPAVVMGPEAATTTNIAWYVSALTTNGFIAHTETGIAGGYIAVGLR